ncbi:MAG: tRNA (guanosine(46)-N7)-methyltransferase TrmB [Mycoplasmataceae bacterium]|nr:tRNA (guanosine(46)-N7)-methyltransferase TrmB [Mycoplasmataceae bacterium]
MGRIRKKQNAIELIKEYSWLKQNSDDIRFNNNPIYLEIGTGKGEFILTNAKKFPNINFFGIEKDTTIVWKALKKISASNEKLNNLFIINDDVIRINDWLGDFKVSKIYINFPDPWFKKRHSQNRLTSLKFLSLYNDILLPNCEIELKTDNQNLFEFSIDNINESKKFIIVYLTKDLYKDNKMLQQNILTEYEERFVKQNKQIFKIIFRKCN